MNFSYNISILPSRRLRKPGDMRKVISRVTINVLFWEDAWLFGILLSTSPLRATEIAYGIALVLSQEVNVAPQGLL